MEQLQWEPLPVGKADLALLTVKSGSAVIDGSTYHAGDTVHGPVESVAADGELLCIPRDSFKAQLDNPAVCKSVALQLAATYRQAGPHGSKMVVFSARAHDRYFFGSYLESYQKLGLAVEFHAAALSPSTAELCREARVVCLFVNDQVTTEMVPRLKKHGVRMLALRCAGTDNVALDACRESGIAVASVPEYGPHSVAEHALALILALNRRLHLAHSRVQAGNLTLDAALMGFEMRGQTVGVVGTGRIGAALAKVLHAMGCRVLAHDVVESPELHGLVAYTDLHSLLRRSRVVSLHIPLTRETQHLLAAETIAMMPRGSLLVNTSRGGLVDTRALLPALKSRHLGGAALDVYEAEAGQFSTNLSGTGITDDVLARLTTFPNVLITCHQGYFTYEAMETIAQATFENVRQSMAAERN